VRVGYGSGKLAFEGAWDRAVEVPRPQAPKVKREVRLLREQGLAAVLSGAASTLEAEELVLRAVLDVEQGRHRAAALGLCAGFELLRGELAAEPLAPAARRRLTEAEASADALAAVATRALRGSLAVEDQAGLRELLERVGAVIDAWRYLSAEDGG
jgi:hypothetical protein